jgi:hypothetical protein
MTDPRSSIAGSSFRGLIGVAREDITPPVGIYARCWGAARHDVAEGVHRPLTLTCVTFQSSSAEPPLALMSADLMIWRSRDEEWFVRGAVLEALELDDSRVMLCLAHTHAAPAVFRDNADRPGGELIEPYLNHLRESAVRAARRAMQQRCDAMLTWRYGRCDLASDRDLPERSGRVVCGYNPQQPADDTLLVGRITNAANEVTGTIVNYACHPTTLAWENRMLSPDYVGAMREVVESATRGPCLFLQGASGELAPGEQYVADVKVADRHGRRLGHAVLATLEAMQSPGSALRLQGVVESGAALAVWSEEPAPVNETLAAVKCAIPLALIPMPSADELEAQWRQTDDPVLKERLWRRRGIRRVIGEGANCEISLWAWRVGDSLLLGQCNEAYSILQRRLREWFPHRAVAVMNLVNGSAGYLPPQELYERDLYQVWQTPFERGSLERVMTAGAAALQRLLGSTVSTSDQADPGAFVLKGEGHE